MLLHIPHRPNPLTGSVAHNSHGTSTVLPARLEHNAETAVQMHFSAQGNRTNNIMRTLTALTAIFLPLNLITGFFGMNFETFPFIHSSNGLWWTLGAMVCIAATMGLLFWRKRYLARTGR